MAKLSIRLGPVARVSIGLVALAMSLFLALDFVLGLLPDDTRSLRQLRQKTSESLAVQVTALIQADVWKTLDRTLQEVLSRDSQVLSVAVRQADGRILAQAGDHQTHWIAPVEGRSTLSQVRVPVFAEKRRCGDIEVSFRSMTPQTLSEWLWHPTVRLIVIMSLASFSAFYL